MLISVAQDAVKDENERKLKDGFNMEISFSQASKMIQKNFVFNDESWGSFFTIRG